MGETLATFLSVFVLLSSQVPTGVFIYTCAHAYTFRPFSDGRVGESLLFLPIYILAFVNIFIKKALLNPYIAHMLRIYHIFAIKI